MEKENTIVLCTASIVKRPKRKLILMRANKAQDYWSFCEEKGCDCVGIPECEMIYFQSESFENEDEFGTAIDNVNRAMSSYNLKQYGYEYALDLAPKYNYGASKEMGAKQAIPVRSIV